MILSIDEDLIMVVGEPTRDYKRRLMGLEQDTLERSISLADRVIQQQQLSREEELKLKGKESQWGAETMTLEDIL